MLTEFFCFITGLVNLYLYLLILELYDSYRLAELNIGAMRL